MTQLPLTPFDFLGVQIAENPEPRVACCLVLDVSGSMEGEAIQELNNGLRSFKEELLRDDLASKRVQVSIVTFGGSVEVVSDFRAADELQVPTLTASGRTPMGQAVAKAMDLIENQKQLYRTWGAAYYRPWIFLISDGEPTDEWQSIASRAKQKDQEGSFVLFCVGVEDADMDILQHFSTRAPVKLDGLRFRDLFLWLSRSMRAVSDSAPGQSVTLESPRGWASI